MREYPKTGEIWKHYKGEECRILGILRNGNRDRPEQLMVAYELVKLETTATTSISRFYRSIEDFMDVVEVGTGVNRFDRINDDITAEIWEQSFALCET